MRTTRTARRRPSPATAISIVAPAPAMSGSAYAATSGTFILAKANTATRGGPRVTEPGRSLGE
jgi:hypothetical protein